MDNIHYQYDLVLIMKKYSKILPSREVATTICDICKEEIIYLVYKIHNDEVVKRHVPKRHTGNCQAKKDMTDIERET